MAKLPTEALSAVLVGKLGGGAGTSLQQRRHRDSQGLDEVGFSDQ